MKWILLLALFTIICIVQAGDCSGEKCKPNTHFKVDCNTCICTEDGNIACTDRACRPSSSEKGLPRICQPGTTFKRDCNTCTCNADGTSARCTEIACRIDPIVI